MRLSQKERVFVALLGIAAASGLTMLLLILVKATNVFLPADTKFGIVFDAGSSHTSLFVYQWPANKEKDTGVVSQTLACQIEGPGISSYASDPTQAGESLKSCLEEALALIPQTQHQETPTFLGATAGMRLLSQKNSSQARDILAAVSLTLSKSPVDFWGAEILAGQDEDSLNFTQNLTVEGTGNPRDCVAALRNLFNSSSCKDQDCAFNGVYQPPVYGQFYAFSNFYYTFHFLNLTSRQPLNIVNDTVWKFCQTPWKLVEASYPGQERWLRDYCASGLYILVLLLEGYKFSEETWPNIQFQKQAGGMDIGWTLGYMLNLTGMIPAEAPTQWRAQSYSIWMAGVVFAVLTLVAVLGAVAVQLFWTQD
ncbi:ectonucleoside triphosphate diphosphohydrolase 8 isoform X2 [Microtus pennsylvanicus]|uniref:ectonucleoside triphosphate diphosphohydrolase 8 isoform X2 n=1 Tax=Microtus pennsylvanicus TaxID=10058 RepID=UPI003F6CEBA1